jgi:hypothetical protein
VPPPPAWGASPPWRYGERPDEVLARAAEALARGMIHWALPGPQAGVFGLAAAVLFLREVEGAEAADQFMLMEGRTRRVPGLPGVVRALREAEGLAGKERLKAYEQALGEAGA